MGINLEYIRGNVVANIQLGDLTGQVVFPTKSRSMTFRFDSPTTDVEGRIRETSEGELVGHMTIDGDEYAIYTNNDTLFVDDVTGLDAGELTLDGVLFHGHILDYEIACAKRGDDTVLDIHGNGFTLQGLIEPTRREINATVCTAEAVYEVHPQGDEHVLTRNGSEVFRMKTYDIWSFVRPTPVVH